MKVGKRLYGPLKEIMKGNTLKITFYPRDTHAHFEHHTTTTLTEKIFQSLKNDGYIDFDRAVFGGITNHLYKITDKGIQAVKDYEQKHG